MSALTASASNSDPGLGSATGYAVLATSTVTNTGPSTINGSVGLSPGSAVTGFPPAVISNGTLQVANGVAAQAGADALTAYQDAASRGPATSIPVDLAGQTLIGGVYVGATLSLSGQLTLDGQGNSDSVFILQSDSTLTTATGSSITLVNNAQACHVFWQIGSSATLGTASDFTGTVLAHDSVTATTGADVAGRLIALDGAVTLDTNVITAPSCATATGGSPTPTPSGTTSPSQGPGTPQPSPTSATSGGATTPPTNGPTSATVKATVSSSPSAAVAKGAGGSGAKSASRSGKGVSTAATPTARVVAGSATSGPAGGAGTPVIAALAPTARGVVGHGLSVPTMQLAYTGSPVGGMLWLGTGAVLLGATTLMMGHRLARRSPGRHRALTGPA